MDTLLLAAQKAKLDECTNKRKRQKIEPDPNTRFADIEAIKGAIDKAKEREQEWNRQDRAREARKVAEGMMERDMSEFMYEFHVASVVSEEV
jgi:hypothetical protein